MAFKQNFGKLVFFIFLFGFIVRLLSVLPANTVIGFDQSRDLFEATKIFRDHNLAIIGPTAGNNPNLHHGVIFWYYIIIPLIFTRGNPMGVVLWNCFFNSLTIVVMYFFARDLFKSKKAGVIAAILTGVSYQLVQYAGWLSNPTVTVLTVPIFFYALWKYYEGNKRWLPVAFLFMGISIEFELFFIYLIPIGLVLFLLLRMKWPDLRTLMVSIFLFCLAVSSMIATELKFHFGGIKSILGEGNFMGQGVQKSPSFFKLFASFITKWDFYVINFSPNFPMIGMIIGILIMGFLILGVFGSWKHRQKRDQLIFLIVYFLSPSLMFLLGSSNEPWFLIGRPIALILAFTYVLLKVRPRIVLVFILIFVIYANLLAVKNTYGHGQTLLEPDASSIMADQLKAIDYTYQNSNHMPFEINTLTNPLYINAVWGYQYYWYGTSKYGYLPSFAGGDQLYPYDTLPKVRGDEKYLYLIMDTTPRIPPQYRNQIIEWANKVSKLTDEKQFGGVDVQKRILNERSSN